MLIPDMLFHAFIEPTLEIMKKSSVSINGIKWLIDVTEMNHIFTAEEFNGVLLYCIEGHFQKENGKNYSIKISRHK